MICPPQGVIQPIKELVLKKLREMVKLVGHAALIEKRPLVRRP